MLVLTQETRAGSFLQGLNSFPWYQSSSVCPSKVSGIQCIHTMTIVGERTVFDLTWSRK